MDKLEEVIATMKFDTKAEEIAFVVGWHTAMQVKGEKVEDGEIETVGDLIRVLNKLPKEKKLRMNAVCGYDDITGWDYKWKEVEVFDATDGIVIMEKNKEMKNG